MKTNTDDPNKTYLHQIINHFKKTGMIDSDKDLESLLKHYRNLEDALDLEGERFHHAWREAHDNRTRLEDMKRARKNG